MEVFIVSILSGLRGKLCIPGHLKFHFILLRLDPFVFRAAFGGVEWRRWVVSPPICIPFPYEDNLPHLVDAVPFQIELIESQFGGLPTQEASMAPYLSWGK